MPPSGDQGFFISAHDEAAQWLLLVCKLLPFQLLCLTCVSEYARLSIKGLEPDAEEPLSTDSEVSQSEGDVEEYWKCLLCWISCPGCHMSSQCPVRCLAHACSHACACLVYFLSLVFHFKTCVYTMDLVFSTPPPPCHIRCILSYSFFILYGSLVVHHHHVV